MKKCGVIMAGGGGTRFWPLSRKDRPKQLLNLSGKNLMINETVERIHKVIDYKDIFIVTNVTQSEMMEQAMDGILTDEQILKEPSARNTAACIGYAAVEAIRRYGDAVMCIFPADHYIKNEDAFADVLRKAVKEAEETDMLLTIGITPTFPSTGYGYIKYQKNEEGVAKTVEQFVEKPNLETAIEYLSSGEYAWNSGMFVWKASVIMKEFQTYLPEIYLDLMKIADYIEQDNKEAFVETYSKLLKISIDYGIMERSDKVKVIPGDFGWNDVGSWDTLEAMHVKDENQNIVQGNSIIIDTTDSVIYAKDKLIAAIGLENCVVVESDGAILVCKKDRAQDVKKVVEILEEKGAREFL